VFQSRLRQHLPYLHSPPPAQTGLTVP